MAPAVWAQNSGKSLDLKLPPQDIPAASTSTESASAPGTYYGDTSGTPGDAQASVDGAPPRKNVNGSISTGIATGRGIGTTMWNAANINVDNVLGKDSPVDLGLSISVMNAQNLGGNNRWGH
ncbi:MAG: hypothetical protein ABW154_07885 [Dyella sp.]